MAKEVIVTKKEVAEALVFASGFVGHGKSGMEFGNKGVERKLNVRISDATLGYIGERAFCRTAELHGLDLETDNSLRQGKDNGDCGQDIDKIFIEGKERYLVPKLDVKTTKKGSDWLMIEKHRISSSIYVLVHADIPRESREKPELLEKDIECEIAGFAYHRDFFGYDNIPLFRFKRGNDLLKARIAYNLYMQSFDKTNRGMREIFEKNSPEKPFVGIKLSCPEQYGLPRQLLRTDLENLFKVLCDMSIEYTRR